MAYGIRKAIADQSTGNQRRVLCASRSNNHILYYSYAKSLCSRALIFEHNMHVQKTELIAYYVSSELTSYL